MKVYFCLKNNLLEKVFSTENAAKRWMIESEKKERAEKGANSESILAIEDFRDCRGALLSGFRSDWSYYEMEVEEGE